MLEFIYDNITLATLIKSLFTFKFKVSSCISSFIIFSLLFFMYIFNVGIHKDRSRPLTSSLIFAFNLVACKPHWTCRRCALSSLGISSLVGWINNLSFRNIILYNHGTMNIVKITIFHICIIIILIKLATTHLSCLLAWLSFVPSLLLSCFYSRHLTFQNPQLVLSYSYQTYLNMHNLTLNSLWIRNDRFEYAIWAYYSQLLWSSLRSEWVMQLLVGWNELLEFQFFLKRPWLFRSW